MVKKKKLLDLNAMQELGIGSRSTIFRRVERGEIPEPIKFGNAHNSKYYWREDEVKHYLAKIGYIKEVGVLNEYKI